ncbi:hypothetical protein EG327_009947 [Venturia inaequalis]|uniref:Uncharacterized protein n=1 Tax=Venturia inaequalis TaxID=5025 RepID=A0A8H3UKY4_VENIN|nr:hypothetical protein EG327_009947 [Venturia inaequalis]
MSMFSRLRSKLGRKKARPEDDTGSDDEGWPEHSLGARRGEVSDAEVDDGDDDLGQAGFDGWIPPDMADVLRENRAASDRRAKRGSYGAGKVPPAPSNDRRTQRHTWPRRRHGPERQTAPRETFPRTRTGNRLVREPRPTNILPEVQDPSLEEIEDPEAPHGPYDTVGSIQRGVDMFRAGDATPDIFMPHLAAHGEHPQHLALPYDMEHAHPSLYRGAPLIRGFSAHDAILESMQQYHRENYPGRR